MRPPASVSGHTLDAVHARLIFQARKHVLALDRGDHFLETAKLSFIGLHDLDLPAVEIGITLVHAQQVGREQRRLIAAGSRAHLQDDAFLVGFVLGQQQQLDAMLQIGQARGQRIAFLARKLAHLGVDLARFQHLVEISQLVAGTLQFGDRLDQGRQVGILLRQPDEIIRSRHLRLRQARSQLLVSRENPVELVIKRHLRPSLRPTAQPGRPARPPAARPGPGPSARRRPCRARHRR